jgi:hypothetical protein
MERNALIDKPRKGFEGSGPKKKNFDLSVYVFSTQLRVFK